MESTEREPKLLLYQDLGSPPPEENDPLTRFAIGGTFDCLTLEDDEDSMKLATGHKGRIIGSLPCLEESFVGFRVASKTNVYNLSNFVLVGNKGNEPESPDAYLSRKYFDSNLGQVCYDYYIGKYLVTNNEYVEFLNSVAKIDTYGLFRLGYEQGGLGLTPPVNYGITRTGTQGNYIYSSLPNMSNKPVVFVTWYDIARYCNWLHNNKPVGLQNNSTTEDGAYLLNGIGGLDSNANTQCQDDIPKRKKNAKYYIPSESEWYKAAYHKANGLSGEYWGWATQSDETPQCVKADDFGNGTEATDCCCSLDSDSDSDSDIIILIHNPPPPTNPSFGDSEEDSEEDFEELFYCVQDKDPDECRNTLFDRSNWQQIIPSNYLPLLNAAASRWENFIKIPQNVFDNDPDFCGIKINSFILENNPLGGYIASALINSRIGNITTEGSLSLNNSYKNDIAAKSWIDILTHELGHLLGLVTTGSGGFVNSTNALQAYNTIINSNVSKIPLENTGGPGTANKHWLYNNNFIINGLIHYGFINEVMVANASKESLKNGTSNFVISQLSIKYLVDLGYEEKSIGASEGSPTIANRFRNYLFSSQNNACNNCYCISSKNFNSQSQKIINIYQNLLQCQNICEPPPECSGPCDDNNDCNEGCECSYGECVSEDFHNFIP